MSARLDPLACAAFLVSAFVLAGLCQAVWLASASSWRFGAPIDAGRTFRGRRLLGDNKTWRGLVVMVPATSLSFALVAVLAQETAVGVMLWPVPASADAAAGLLAGLGFMARELPNSFTKRQLSIPAGAAARGPSIRPVFFGADRIDSPLGMVVALSLALPIPATTWLWILLVGPAIHGL